MDFARKFPAWLVERAGARAATVRSASRLSGGAIQEKSALDRSPRLRDQSMCRVDKPLTNPDCWAADRPGDKNGRAETVRRHARCYLRRPLAGASVAQQGACRTHRRTRHILSKPLCGQQIGSRRLRRRVYRLWTANLCGCTAPICLSIEFHQFKAKLMNRFGVWAGGDRGA
jgi:hypothetical protein